MEKLTKVLNAIDTIILKIVVFSTVALLLLGCSGLEQSEQKRLRQTNAKGEFIHRTHDEFYHVLYDPEQRIRERYPWEVAQIGVHSKITKEFFRCKGSSIHPPHIKGQAAARQVHDIDCGGFQKHSLPLRGDQEFIYPILIELLNEVQEKTGNKVVITCGHRCPTHNTYADPSSYNQNSKHMIGAEVDFYVQGLEMEPEKIIQILIDYYRIHQEHSLQRSYTEFVRLDVKKLNISTPPWYNKEILIKLYQKSEGRDFDNRHPYPYIGIQVRFDRDLNAPVNGTWQQAFNCYRRY